MSLAIRSLNIRALSLNSTCLKISRNCIFHNINTNIHINGSIQLMSLHKQFEEAKSKLQKLTNNHGNETKLRIYGLFKQATEGSPKFKEPISTDIVDQAKWNAWKSNEQMTKEDAQRNYIELINSLTKTQEDETFTQKYESLKIECIGGLRKIIINRPKRMNAFNFQLFDDLKDALKEADIDVNTRITALTGAGLYFTSGNDLSNFSGFSPDTAPKISTNLKNHVFRFISTLIDFTKPLAAVVNGPAIGIGVTLLPYCDIVYCSDRATFTTPFSSLGQSPEGGSSALFPHLMGYAKSSEILMFNKKITADEAWRLGLVSEVFPDCSLQAEAWQRLKEFSKLPAKSLLYSKELLRAEGRALLHKVNISECERLEERMQSKDCFNAITAFFNRKKNL